MASMRTDRTRVVTDEEMEAGAALASEARGTTQAGDGRRLVRVPAGPMRVQPVLELDAVDLHDVRIVCWNPRTGRI
jgi:hypothetical protein